MLGSNPKFWRRFWYRPRGRCSWTWSSEKIHQCQKREWRWWRWLRFWRSRLDWDSRGWKKPPNFERYAKLETCLVWRVFNIFVQKQSFHFHSCFIGGGDDKKLKKEDDLQIINEIPGKSLGMGNRPMHSASTASSLSGLFPQGNLFNSPSLLAAQDPFFALNSALQGAGGSSTNTMDLLQKCKFVSSFSIAFIMNDFTREERKMSAARIQSLNLYSFFF